MLKLFNMVGALDVPSTGRILVDGQDLAALSRQGRSRLRRDRIGFVFQAYNLMPVLTAYENAESVLALQGAPERERRDKLSSLDQSRDHQEEYALLEQIVALKRDRQGGSAPTDG